MAKIVINPYDFQNPVGKPTAFAGRSKALSDIRYYLDQASVTRPTNLAIVGARASGKTSLLNMIAHDAVERNILTVRINFDASHAASQLTFFAKVFDAIIYEVVKHDRASGESKCFGGRGGPLMRQYADCMVGMTQPNFENSELLFPDFYARAVARGHLESPIPQSLFIEDLESIAAEVGKPIALIMDECNVIAANQSILQAMRHMFQNLEKYMLVLTGTEALFPMIDDIYSPVGRGFKRIEVERFESPAETYECMKLPCVTAGVSTEVLSIFSTDPEIPVEVVTDALQDLHDFTGGNPHEIQLACHFMFREMQSGGDETLAFNSAVIEAVLRELAPDGDRRMTLFKIQNLDLPTFRTLGLFSRWGFGFDRRVYHGLVETERVIHKSSFDALQFDRGAVELTRMNWLEETTEGYKCLVPPLECILIKYVAKSKRVNIGSLDSSTGALSGGISASFRCVEWPALELLLRDKTQLSHQVWCERFGTLSQPNVYSSESFHTLDLSIIDTDVRMIQFELVVSGTSHFRRTLIGGVGAGDLDEFQKLVSAAREKVTETNNSTAEFSVVWNLFEHQRTFATPWGLRESDWTSAARDPEFLSCPIRGIRFHAEMRREFLSGGDRSNVYAALREMIPSSINAALNADCGFMALAIGIPGTRAYLGRIIATGVDAPLVRYNHALASLFLTPPGVSAAVAELKAIPPADAPEEFLSMLELGFEDAALVFTEWRPPSDGSASPPLKSFVGSAIVALERAIASGAPQRVIAARSEV